MWREITTDQAMGSYCTLQGERRRGQLTLPVITISNKDLDRSRTNHMALSETARRTPIHYEKSPNRDIAGVKLQQNKIG